MADTAELTRVDAAELGWQTDVDAEGETVYTKAPTRTEQVEIAIAVYPRNVTPFHKTVAKFAKIAARHGQEVTCRENGVIEVQHPLFKKRTIQKFCFIVSIPPMVGEKGRILGHFERAEDNTSQYVHVFDESADVVVKGFLPRAGECDHCGVNRNRHDGYVCETSEGVKLIGSTCLKDFLGIDPGFALASQSFYTSVSDGERDEDSWGSGGVRLISTDYLCREAYRVVRKHGGYSAGEVAEMLNRHLNILLHGAFTKYDQEIKDSYKGYDPEFDIQAFCDYVEQGVTDFAYNLRTALSQEVVEPKRVRLVLAGVGSFVSRTLKIAANAEADAVRLAKIAEANGGVAPEPHHLAGAVGDRITIVGEVVRTYLKQGDFGTTCIVSIRTLDGGVAVNFHTGADRPEAGKTYAIKGTIKEHKQSDKFGPQTVLTRAIYSAPPVQGALL